MMISAGFQACTILFKNTWKYSACCCRWAAFVFRVSHAVVLQYTSYRDCYPSIIGCSINLSVVAVFPTIWFWKFAELPLWKIWKTPLKIASMSPSSLPKRGVEWWHKNVSGQILWSWDVTPKGNLCTQSYEHLPCKSTSRGGKQQAYVQQNIHLPLHLFEALSQDNLPGDHCPPLSRKSPTWELQWTVTIAAGEDQHTHQPKHL